MDAQSSLSPAMLGQTEEPLVTSTPPKRVLLFVFDAGTGIGHLRRISCIAKSLQRHFACLVVTGHREITSWFISNECEYVHLPAWESLLPEKAAYWGRTAFLPLSIHEAVRLRKGILRGLVEAYAPDLIIVDHLPLGAHEELEDIIRETPCVKYLVTRGVLNLSGTLLDLVLGKRACDYLDRYYDRIVVAADQRVVDFAKEYSLPMELASKTIHVGYVVESISADDIAACRADRKLKKGTPWVVVSAGGGQLGERLIEYCIALSTMHQDVCFDIIIGPRSKLMHVNGAGANARIQAQSHQLPLLNASADVVICSGGYNTLLESLQGAAHVLCVPNWKDPRDEQTHHPECLQKFAEITIVPDIYSLGEAFIAILQRAKSGSVQDVRGLLDMSGSFALAQLAIGDIRERNSYQLAAAAM